MTKHTPGPWKQSWVRPNKEKGHTFDPRCSILARSAEYDADIRIADIPDPLTEEEEANARLIAAAPVLLAACQTAFDALDVTAGEKT